MYASKVASQHSGGVALVWKVSRQWTIKSQHQHGPNVISCELICRSQHWLLVGAYVPPDDLDTLSFVTQAINARPTLCPILLGDFNLDFDTPRGTWESQIVGEISIHGSEDMLPHFAQPYHCRGGYSWRQMRNGAQVTS